MGCDASPNLTRVGPGLPVPTLDPRSGASLGVPAEATPPHRTTTPRQSPTGRPTPADAEPLPCAAAFVFALGVESGGFVDRLEEVTRRRYKTRIEYDGMLQGRRVLAVDSGVGADLAARATDRVILRHRPAWIVSAGFAGALRDDLRRGRRRAVHLPRIHGPQRARTRLARFVHEGEQAVSAAAAHSRTSATSPASSGRRCR